MEVISRYPRFRSSKKFVVLVVFITFIEKVVPDFTTAPEGTYDQLLLSFSGVEAVLVPQGEFISFERRIFVEHSLLLS